ncbi:hypothetical protein JHK82_048412 [Glycine max]|nr:hypothetical protein JHK82_048412 [Glycine max]KAG5103333.1 hypothetical protein JHK84_048302 [Glycine max]
MDKPSALSKRFENTTRKACFHDVKFKSVLERPISPAIHSAILLLVPSLFNLRRFDSASGTPFLETPRNVKCRAPFPLVVHSLGYNAKEAVVVAGALAFAWLSNPSLPSRNSAAEDAIVGPQVIYVFGRDDNDESIATGSEISDVASWETVNDDEMEVLEDSREVCYNTCKKPIKDSQFAAHAELCRSLQLTKQTMLELDDNIGNRKPPRKEKKKLGASSASILKIRIQLLYCNINFLPQPLIDQASARREQRRSESLDNIDFALSQSYLNSQVRVVPFPNEVTGKLFSSNTSFEYKTVFYMSSEGKNLLHEVGEMHYMEGATREGIH